MYHRGYINKSKGLFKADQYANIFREWIKIEIFQSK